MTPPLQRGQFSMAHEVLYHPLGGVIDSSQHEESSTCSGVSTRAVLLGLYVLHFHDSLFELFFIIQ
jgi:hypothetical protein